MLCYTAIYYAIHEQLVSKNNKKKLNSLFDQICGSRASGKNYKIKYIPTSHHTASSLLDPVYLILHKNVEILTSNGITHKGYVYAIDVVSGSIVIIESQDVALENATDDNADDIEQKKTNIKAWLTKHFIQVEEDGLSLILGDDLVIEPPYDKEHCFSGNTIILQRIQDILAKMPDNQ
ncbi:hypothetical protein CBL_06498 [Carabus blaptoides fortunei]